jgi:tRNA 2-(methylsulfanyl)-N6-isopentenyladenosine37 hydroxylase
MSVRPEIQPVLEFLSAPTPTEWLSMACESTTLLLSDHANCEKKAASSALGLTYRYTGERTLLHQMSRLAREELRHFEQVLDLMEQLAVPYQNLSASRYAGRLHSLVRKGEPDRLVDVLILGAVVEARSCERFYRLAQVLPSPIAPLYQQLINSEARHFTDYLNLAERYGDVTSRLPAFLAAEAELITSPDDEFRFHSGVPV